MKNFEYSVKVTIRPTQVDDLLADAFYSGISYWCDELRYDTEPTEDVNYMSEALTRGAVIGLHDSEEDKWEQITIEKVLQAIADEQVDFEDYDSSVADAVIQRACFGEVIYG